MGKERTTTVKNVFSQMRLEPRKSLTNVLPEQGINFKDETTAANSDKNTNDEAHTSE